MYGVFIVVESGDNPILEISRKGKLLILISKSILNASVIVVSLPYHQS